MTKFENKDNLNINLKFIENLKNNLTYKTNLKYF